MRKHPVGFFLESLLAHLDPARIELIAYPGVTTSVEALWMGVPVLSMQGERFLSCTASSIARNAGLWAQVLPSPLFDAPRFARNFEDALWGMWQHHQEQQGIPA